jgi:Zn-dependent peptidase ImmA (M78 family)/transcriptional regulator with XRE-family HTH domain
MRMHNFAFNKEMLTLAREAKGYTQSQLAKLLGCTQSRLSKLELGDLLPQAEDIGLMSQVLSQPVEFFSKRGTAKPSSVSFYRKTNTLPLKMLTRCNAEMNVRRLEIENEVGTIKLGSQSLPFFPTQQFGGPMFIAKKVREFWGVPRGPIKNLTKLVEDAGCIVVDYPFPSSKLDGLCLRAPEKPPIIFLNSSFPKSRRRLSLAHELGHLVMHTDPHEDVEDEAWQFAAEFLMPSQEIGSQFYPINIDRLGQLKSYWGVSMQALLQHGKRLGKIGESYNRFLWMQIGKCGYRINEPFEDAIPDEKATDLQERLKGNT